MTVIMAASSVLKIFIGLSVMNGYNGHNENSAGIHSWYSSDCFCVPCIIITPVLPLYEVSIFVRELSMSLEDP